MRRAIDFPALAALIGVVVATGAAAWWLWQRSQVDPGEIRCSTGGHSVMACYTDAGNLAMALAFVAAPLIIALVYKAFFTRFKSSRRSAD